METINITLRDWKIEDSIVIPKLANNKKIWDNLRDEFPYPYLESDAIDFINKVKQNDRIFSKAIEYKNALVGCISIEIKDDVRRYSGLLGYWIGEEYWNKGIASKAIIQMTDLAFKELKLVRVYAKVFAKNGASMRALEKAGYTNEGLFKRAVYKNGQFYNQVLYAKVNE